MTGNFGMQLCGLARTDAQHPVHVSSYTLCEREASRLKGRGRMV